jgi:hypothetical protein
MSTTDLHPCQERIEMATELFHSACNAVEFIAAQGAAIADVHEVTGGEMTPAWRGAKAKAEQIETLAQNALKHLNEIRDGKYL